MARLPRYFAPNQPQHVIQRGNNREIIFVTDNDYRFFLECLEEAAGRYQADIHAYVLMTNHVHLLVTPQHEKSLPRMLQSVGRRYIQYFNFAYQRTGTLWEGRYRATIIDSDQYLLTCSRYIELNPVRARMVAHPREYRWSSYHAHALGKPDPLLTGHPLYRKLGRSATKRQAAYRALFKVRLGEQALNTIRDATNKAWVLGDDHFREQIESLTDRRASPKPKGRPVKRESDSSAV